MDENELSVLAANLEWTPVGSSTISEIGYLAEPQILFVWFRDGAKWIYIGVDGQTYRDFLDAPSKGRFLYDEIRGAMGRRPCPRGQLDQKYPAQEISSTLQIGTRY